MVIKNLIKKQKKLPKSIYCLGFYRPEDFYFAHLIEHCLAVFLRDILGITIISANSGAGFVFLQIQNSGSLRQINDFILNFNFDSKLLSHQKKILISEKLFKDKIYFFRNLYECVETNAGSVDEKESLFKVFVRCNERVLFQKTKKTFDNINWLVFDDDIKKSFLSEDVSKSRKCPREQNCIFPKAQANGKFAKASISTMFRTQSKVDDFILYQLNQKILFKLENSLTTYCAHDLANDLFKTWNSRNFLHFGGYFPSQFVHDFAKAVTEELDHLKVDGTDFETIISQIKKYLADRSKEEEVFEIAEFGSLLDRVPSKTDLKKALEALLKTKRIYSQIENGAL